MRKLIQWVMAAALICGAMVFTACRNEDNPVDGETGASGIAMIVKNGQIDYFRQIETAFRDVCQEKDLEAYSTPRRQKAPTRSSLPPWRISASSAARR